MLRRFLPYFRLLKPVRLAFAATLLCGVVYGATSGFGLPFVTGKVFPLIFGDSPPSSWKLLGVVAILPAVFLVRGLAGFLNIYGLSYCGLRVLRAIQLRVFERLQLLPLEFFDRNSTGDLMARVLGDAGALQNVLTTTANSLIKQPVTFVGAMGALIYLSSKNDQLLFALFCVLLVPFIALLMRYTGGKLHSRARQLQAQSGILSARVQENLLAAKEIRVFTLEERELDKFRGALELAHRLQLKVVKYSNILSPAVEFVSTIGVAVAIYYAVRSGITLEQLVPLVVALFMSYQPLRSVGVTYNQFKTGLASLDRLEHILCHEDTLEDPAQPVSINGVRGEVEFCNVSFRYLDAPVLTDVSQKIQAGEIIALVGASGAGKTTFASLIPRLYEAREGQVLLDGVDVRSYRKRELRSRIAIVPQDPVLFNDTIENNILIGRPDASREQIEVAARAAFAHDFISSLSESYDTIVGDRGTRLSGGEKQRVAIARAFLKDAPILILDEATSSLDSESESMVQRALGKLIEGRTAFIIAHRFSTVKIAHRILVFDSGRVVATGTHDALYADCATYRNLYDKQGW